MRSKTDYRWGTRSNNQNVAIYQVEDCGSVFATENENLIHFAILALVFLLLHGSIFAHDASSVTKNCSKEPYKDAIKF